MPLKAILTKEEYGTIEETSSQRELYKEDGDNYVLDLDDNRPPSPLIDAKKHEQKRRQDAEIKLKDAQKQLDEIKKAQQTEAEKKELDKLRRQGDIKKLEASWATKNQTLESEWVEKYNSMQTALQTQILNNESRLMAERLAGDNANLLLPHIQNRLKIDIEEGIANIRVLDDDGQVSADNLQELEKKFLTDKSYSAIVVGSNGSGAGGTQKLGEDGPTEMTVERFSKLKGSEQSAWANENPDEFRTLNPYGSII